MRALIEIMILPDYVLCYIRRVLAIFEIVYILDNFGKLQVLISKVGGKL